VTSRKVRLLKIGGSVITDKSSRETLDRKALERCAEKISDASCRTVIVHGAGSFGHPHVKEFGLENGGTNGVRNVQLALEVLCAEFTGELESQGVGTTAIHPSSCASADDLQPLARQVERVLETGLTPVLHGDLMPSGERFKVVSGDRFLEALPEHLDFDAVGACSSTVGVLDSDGEVLHQVDGEIGHEHEQDSVDVTGGMAKKVERMSGLEPDTCIFGPEELEDFLNCELPGTKVL
jgi:isopentenyl phosphate kinase